jgi:hypothetical protein
MGTLNSTTGANLSAKREELQKLMSSEDGKKIQEMMTGEDQKLKTAVEQGDLTALKGALTSILKTEEGARLAKHLSDLMKTQEK